MIVIVDYGMGNLNSVRRKLYKLGVACEISSDPLRIAAADKIILPGVGHFANAVKEIKVRGLWDPLNEQVLVKKKPILGICLGMQLLAKHSEEGDVAGFGWLDAEVIRFRITDKLKYKVPHMGWNHVSINRPHPLFQDVDLDTGFYFVHSYHLHCNDPADILNETVYEYVIVSAVQRNNIFGVQYHPEKSHEAGEQLLKNFSAL